MFMFVVVVVIGFDFGFVHPYLLPLTGCCQDLRIEKGGGVLLVLSFPPPLGELGGW